ncbi:MAG: hypothetical protein ACFFC7_19830 [Candidatus Hermodarchaeota archaeon]
MKCPTCELVIDKPVKNCPNCGTQLLDFDLPVQKRYQNQTRQERDPLLAKIAYMGISLVCTLIIIIIGIFLFIETIIWAIETILFLISFTIFPILVLLIYFGQPTNLLMGIGFFIVFYIVTPIIITALSRWRHIRKGRPEEASLLEDAIVGLAVSYIISWIVAMFLIISGFVSLMSL